jgi:hypothetical protein
MSIKSFNIYTLLAINENKIKAIETQIKEFNVKLNEKNKGANIKRFFIY